jgi:hypothetical protein
MMDKSFVNDQNKAPNKDLIESDNLIISSEINEKKQLKENDYHLLYFTNKIDSKKNSHPSIKQKKDS